MLGKLTNIESVERWFRSHEPEHPFFTVYHGFQTVAKKPSDIAYRNEKVSNIDEANQKLKSFLIDHSSNGAQFTIFAKNSPDKQDTTGKTVYVELLPSGVMPYGHAIAGLQPTPSVPTYTESDIQAKIQGAVNSALMDYQKDLKIAGLENRIQELENEEPEGFDWGGAISGLVEMLVSKIPSESIGKILENLSSKADTATVGKMADVGGMYMQMKMQEQAAKAQQAAQQKRQSQTTSDDDENDIEYV